MKKKVLGSVLIVGVICVLVAIVWVRYSVKSSDSNISCSLDAVYQYDTINKSDFKYSNGLRSYSLDKLPDSETCVISSPTYNSSTLVVTLNGKDVKVDLNFIKATSLKWTYKGEEYIPEGTEVDSLKPEDFSCVITYEDSTSKEITPTTISAKQASSGAEVSLSDGVNTFVWNATVK